MHFSLKEESYVVIENGSWKIKAGIGVADTNQLPSVVSGFFLSKFFIFLLFGKSIGVLHAFYNADFI